MSKLHVTDRQIYYALKAEARIINERFKPEVIIAIGGGGYIPARNLRTWVDARIYGVNISNYDENDRKFQDGPEKVQWLDDRSLEYIRGKRVLLVDEIDDTRSTLQFCVNELNKDGIKDIAVLVLHNKLKSKPTLDVSDYFSCFDVRGDTWVVYPWEAKSYDEHEEAAKLE